MEADCLQVRTVLLRNSHTLDPITFVPVFNVPENAVHRTLSALAIFLIHLPVAFAASPCPGNGGEPLPALAEMSAMAIKLADLEPICGNDPGYLAYRGAVLLELNQAETAGALLERALMMAPHHAGAQADYARALAILGDTRAAHALFESLLERTDVPEGLRGQLQAWKDQLGETKKTSNWQMGGSLGWRFGHDTNLNSAPSSNSLDLTMPDGIVTLPLASGFQGGAATMLEANLQASRNLPSGGRLQLLADLRSRHSSEVTATNYLQTEALAILTLPTQPTPETTPPAANQISLGLSRLDYGGAHLYDAGYISLARIFQTGACLAGGSFDAGIRHYPVTPNLDGYFAGTGANLRCPLGSGRISFLGRLGIDKASNPLRPGGDQHRWDLQLTYGYPLGDGQLITEINLGHQQDRAPYNELLANGALRNTLRIGFRAEWVSPMTRQIDAVVVFETSQQNSNLPLFDIKGSVLWLGARWKFGEK